MLDFVSRAVVGIAVLGLMVGLYHLVQGAAALGGYLVGASVGALVTAALLDGCSQAISAMEGVKHELRRWRLEVTEG